EHEEKPITLPAHTQFIKTNDLDASVLQVTKGSKEWKIIDISECRFSDLWVHTDGKFDKKSGQFEFTQTECLLLQALNNNEKIILKGKFSSQLIESLTPFFLQRALDPEASGQLTLVTNDTIGFEFLPLSEPPHVVEEEQKRDY